MKTRIKFDVFDIIGPIMIGPSSSHTAGAVRIGLMVGQLCNYSPIAIEVLFHGSLASTYSFHKTDVAVLAGILGIPVEDERIKDSLKIAKDKNINIKFGTINVEGAYPSTIIIKLKDQNYNEYVVKSATIGGGNILIQEINGSKIDLNGKQNNLVINLNHKSSCEIEKIINDEISSAYTIGLNNISNMKYLNVVCKGKIDESKIEKLKNLNSVNKLYYFKTIIAESNDSVEFYETVKDLVNKSRKNNCSISDTVIKFECKNSNRTEKEVIDEMEKNYTAMNESIKKGIKQENLMLANIFGGNAKKMNKFITNGRSICGISLSKVIKNALAVMEVNGSMGKIVACPTAGSAGTLPAAVITIAEINHIDKKNVIKSLFTGAGIGMIIAKNSTISGSVGGCQAECGVASAMAAAIITELFNGNYNQITSSSSIALGNILGLVCDPVAGTVELPCIQRNVMAATNAIISSEMALANIDSVIPLDEMIGALNEVGALMNISLKDTLGAGISNTPTARKIEADLFKK